MRVRACVCVCVCTVVLYTPGVSLPQPTFDDNSCFVRLGDGALGEGETERMTEVTVTAFDEPRTCSLVLHTTRLQEWERQYTLYIQYASQKTCIVIVLYCYCVVA